MVPTETPSSSFSANAAFSEGTTSEQVVTACTSVQTNKVSNGRMLNSMVSEVVEIHVEAFLRSCDFEALTSIDGKTCFEIFTTITAPPSAGISPSLVTGSIESDIQSGDFAAQLEAEGLEGAVVSLPPSEEPSSQPSAPPSVSVMPSVLPSFKPSLEPSLGPTMFSSLNPTAGPSVPDADCINDDSFRLNGKTNRGCTWVAKRKTKRRCKKKDRISKRRVKEFCPRVCKKKCQPCGRDTINFGLNGDISKDCLWVSNNPLNRCEREDTISKKKAKEFCLSACDLRCSCLNTMGTFVLNGRAKKCNQIRMNQCTKEAIGQSGEIKTVEEFCPKKCRACY